MPTSPSQEILIRRHLNWERVEQRLAENGAIARAFPIDMLRARCTEPPFFCHYAAWRLGTWTDASLIARFEALLSVAEGLPNWSKEHGLLQGGHFADFWSLYWQLQVAEFLTLRNLPTSWNGTGPDLRVDTALGEAFVECFVFRKSFGIEAYVEELLQMCCSNASIIRNSYLPFSVATEAQMSEELSRLLLPFVDEQDLSEKQVLAAERYPLVLSHGQHASMRIVLEGPDVAAYDPSIGSTDSGDPAEHLRIALGEAVRAKAGKNSLKAHRPNLVLVSLLLSRDAQGALHRRVSLGHELPEVQIPSDIDAVAFSVVGIDKTLDSSDLQLVPGSQPKPAIQFILSGQ
jgi:hypothetical protein